MALPFAVAGRQAGRWNSQNDDNEKNEDSFHSLWMTGVGGIALPSPPRPRLPASGYNRRMFVDVARRLCESCRKKFMAKPTNGPHGIEITSHDIHLPFLPQDLSGTTIAQISDLHRGGGVK